MARRPNPVTTISHASSASHRVSRTIFLEGAKLVETGQGNGHYQHESDGDAHPVAQPEDLIDRLGILLILLERLVAKTPRVEVLLLVF